MRHFITRASGSRTCAAVRRPGNDAGYVTRCEAYLAARGCSAWARSERLAAVREDGLLPLESEAGTRHRVRVPLRGDRREVDAALRRGDDGLGGATLRRGVFSPQGTLGDALKLLVHGEVAPDRMALFMPTSDGPCRFGQYGPYIKEVLKEMGFDGVTVVSPTCEDGYSGIGEHADELLRTAWRAMIAGELLTKLLLRIRPYELEKGASDAAYQAALSDLCAAVDPAGRIRRSGWLASRNASSADGGACATSRRLLRSQAADRRRGEIFCRLNTFSNDASCARSRGGGSAGSPTSRMALYTYASHIHL